MAYEIEYRPKTLDEIVGNKATVAALNAVLDTPVSKRPHAFLFIGPPGTGKTTSARIMAYELGGEPGDIVEKDAATERGIDDTRAVQEQLYQAPLHGDARVYIWNEAHKLTNEAQSALLSTFEDTPPHVYVMFTTNEPKKLLAALQQRCRVYTFAPLSDADIRKVIARVVQKERLVLHKDVEDAIVDNAYGSSRLALVLLGSVVGIKDVEQQIELLQGYGSSPEMPAIELARTLFPYKGGALSWKAITEKLSKLEEDPERVRHCIRSYAAKIMMGGYDNSAMLVADSFKTSMFYGTRADLTLACAEAFARVNAMLNKR